MRLTHIGFALIAALACNATSGAAQEARRTTSPIKPVNEAPAAAVPPGYVIGASDMLSIVVYGDKDMSADVVVRPDGRISLPLINDINAAGLAPEELRKKLTEAVGKIVQDPDVTVIVKEIHSRNVFITGQVQKAGMYPLTNDMTVLQLISVGGGVLEYAKSKDITIERTENGRKESIKFNYKDRKRSPDILLKPGDVVVVP
jgi:polysaccharide biosynthesis/export protein